MSDINYEAASHHITAYMPVRVLDETDRQTYAHCYLVGLQRGFEQLEIAVYFDHGINAGDAEEAAFEYLLKHYPESLTEEERENQCATQVRRAL